MPHRKIGRAFARLNAVAFAIACAPLASNEAAAQVVSETTKPASQLPAIVITTPKPANKSPGSASKPAPSAGDATAKPLKKKAAKSTPPPEPSADAVPASEPPPAAAASPAEAMRERIGGVGRSGLAVPLNSTPLAGDQISGQLPSVTDSAELLGTVPGVSTYGAGGVSGLPVINGLNDDRVRIQINGMQVSAACPNRMNPPLSYVDPTQVAFVDVIAGITPVSKGGDSIGGTINVETAPPEFAEAGETIRTSGKLSTFIRSVNDRVTFAGAASAASRNVAVSYAGAWTEANNYARGDDGPEVLSTLFESENHAVKLAFRDAHNLLVIEGALEDAPYQGFVNQRMDMVENKGRLINARYVGHLDFGLLEARAFYHSTKHEMDILEDKKPGEMPMWVDGIDAGYMLKAEINVAPADIVRVGNEFHHQGLEDRWPPVPGSMMMGPYTYRNINDGTRDRLGTFAEWEHAWSSALSTMLGVRNDLVWMDTGDVQAYSPANCLMFMMGMCMMPNPDAAAARAFNELDRDRFDANLDVTAQVRFAPTTSETYEIGLARKTRSPNLYERYAWGVGTMATNMIGWYGDANGYIGNPDLEPEVAHTASFTADWHDPAKAVWQLKVTPYYTHVDDYIDGAFVAEQMRGMGMAARPTGFVTMRFENQEARLYGVNVSGRLPLWSDPVLGRFALTGLLSYVDGKNLETGDNLYHMMPLNGRLTLTHGLGGWSSAVELELVDDKDEVNALRREPETAGYTLVHLRTSYEWESLRLDLGIENVFDKLYHHPLGGVDFAGYKAGGQTGRIGPIPGEGRSFNVGATVKF